MTSEFLALLLEQSEPEEFDAVEDGARARHEQSGRLAELEKQCEITLLLRERLARHRLNEGASQLLNDSASDLATLRDLEQILQAIIQRARQVTSCDLARV